MANRHYEHALKGLPCRVSTTAQLIYQLICYRYDDRPTLDNGKPNKGYRKSYPGMAEFMSATGRARNACNTAIESLIKNNLIVRLTIGKPGSRAEYRPIYTLNALDESVPNTIHVYKEYKSRLPIERVSTTTAKSIADVPNVLRIQDTISTKSNHKYDKSKIDDYVNYERWQIISQSLPKLLVDQWVHTKESEDCFNKILKRTTLKAFIADLRRLNFDRAHDLTGLFMSYLGQRAGVITPSKDLPNDNQFNQNLAQLSTFDFESKLLKHNSSLDFKKIFKLPD
jgi:hypothetical protein